MEWLDTGRFETSAPDEVIVRDELGHKAGGVLGGGVSGGVMVFVPSGTEA